jgi:hypothetical protein
VAEMRELSFKRNEHLVTKIIQGINKFRFSLHELKAQQKKLDTMDLEGNDYSHHKEILNAWLYLEHNRNLALMEHKRQRAT